MVDADEYYARTAKHIFCIIGIQRIALINVYIVCVDENIHAIGFSPLQHVLINNANKIAKSQR